MKCPALILTAVLVVASISTSPAAAPPDIKPILAGITSDGVVVERGLVVEIAHPRGDPTPGMPVFVSFYATGVVDGRWNALEAARSGTIRRVCRRDDLVAIDIHNFPDNATPPPFANMRTYEDLYIIVDPIHRDGPRIVRAVWEGEYWHTIGGIPSNPYPAVHVYPPPNAGGWAVPGKGWSGSKVINGRGEVVGLLITGNSTTGYGDTMLGITPTSAILRCR